MHVGDLTRLRAHEGTLRIGDRAVFGRDASVNCYLDVEIGAATMVADWVYVCDFDHANAAGDDVANEAHIERMRARGWRTMRKCRSRR